MAAPGPSSPPLEDSRKRHRAWSSSPPREDLVQRIRSLSSGSRSPPHGSHTQSPVFDGLVKGGIVAGIVGGARENLKPEMNTNHTSSLLVSMGSTAGAVGGFRIGRSWKPSEAQKSNARSVMYAIANADDDTLSICESFETDSVASIAGEGIGVNIEVAEDDNQLKLAEHQRPESHLFEYASDNETVVIDDDSVDNAEKLENVITIETLTTDRRMVHMRALLDTGSKSNFIRARKARSTRHHIHPYTRKTRFVSGSGESLYPIGELVMTFRRVSPSGTREPRTFQIRFLVVPDSVPFDVILGIGFCQGAQVFKPGEFFCPLVRPKETDGNKTDTGGDGRGLIFDAAEKQEKEKRKAEQKKTNEEAKKKEREEQAKKRAAAQAAKNSQKP